MLRRLGGPMALGGALLVTLAFGAPAAAAKRHHLRPRPVTLSWSDCGGGFQCATATVPRDYRFPRGRQIKLAVTRLPATDRAHRIGSLFVNFGGPGGDAVASLHAFGGDLFASLNDRFDIVGVDPRGVGESRPSIDCRVNQETLGIYHQPFTTPANLHRRALIRLARRYVRACLRLNPGILSYVSTANFARDLNLIRAAVGDKRLSYLGYSYGTFLGATFESMFPRRTRALVLDGALDAGQYVNHPLASVDEQTAAFERALGRFLAACKADQLACAGFGGGDPRGELDRLLLRLDATPIPAGGEDPRPVDGDDARTALFLGLYAKQLWPLLALALADADAGNGTGVRAFADASYGWSPNGHYDPISDRFFTIGALELRYPSRLKRYFRAGRLSFRRYPHFWSNHGYSEIPYGLYPVDPKGVFRGPFRNPRSAPTLVVGTTFDPATPYAGAKRLVRELGNARLLTMEGDGHTAYGGNSSCIDSAVDAYLENLTVPARGTICHQDVPFVPVALSTLSAPTVNRVLDELEWDQIPAAVSP
jgi:pimeloyl-ACP methyl ester carboxylesterase